VSSWFSRSGASPPSSYQNRLTLPEVSEVPPRIGVRSIRISSELKLETRVKRIFQFNFQSVPNGKRIRAFAAGAFARPAHPAARFARRGQQ
jgi:hypothetical protein